MNPLAAHTLYYAAHTAKSLLWTAGDLLTIYALVNRAGVDPGVAGWLFLGGLMANALADLAIGVGIDRFPRATPWLAGGGLLAAAIAFPMTMLAAPAGIGALALATLAFRLGYAAYDVPHNALLARLADTPDAAGRLSLGRTLGTGIAAALVGLGLRGATGAPALTTLLWVLAAGAVLGGSLALPLLVRMPPIPRGGTAGGGAGLPWSFLIGSLVGIVALGALAKATLHLPTGIAHPDPGETVILLTVGRTAAALLPLAFANDRRGRWLLVALYVAAAPLIATLQGHGGWVFPAMLGLLMGATNLIGWALLPLMARSARGFGLYTMAGKLALGVAGLAMTAALGARLRFTTGGMFDLTACVMIGCVAAAWLLAPHRSLTARPVHGVGLT